MVKQIGVLAVLFVVLLAAVIVKETSRPTAGSLRDQVPLQRLGPGTFTADDVAAIEIAGPAGADPFRVVRSGDVWVVEGAFRAPAAAGHVDTLLQAVVEARGELRLEDPSALSKFDLSAERASTVVLRDAAGTALADFALGRSSGTQGAFVRPRFEGVRDGAYAVSQNLRSALGLPRTQPGAADPELPRAAHFHDVNLPNLALEETASVEVESPLWKVTFVKSDVEWSAADGAPDLPLRPSGIRQLVQTLGGSLTATTLVDPAQREELGLNAAPYRVTAVLPDGTRRSAVGAADRENGRYFVRLDTEQDPDVVYECTQYAWERLFPPGSQLFEFASLGVANKGLGQVRIEGGDVPFAMTRPGSDANLPWIIREPAWSLLPADAQLRNYVTLLNSVRPVDWYAGEEAFVEEAAVRWGTEEAALGELDSLRIGQTAPGGAGLLAILPGDPDRVVVLAESTTERLVPDVLTLFDPRPLSAALPTDVSGVEVRNLGADGADPVQMSMERDAEGVWTVRHGGTESRGDVDAITSWVDDLLQVEIVERGGEDSSALTEIEIRRGGPRRRTANARSTSTASRS
jgi:hypothetical protein